MTQVLRTVRSLPSLCPQQFCCFQLPPGDLEVLFSNIDDIIQVSSRFLHGLQETACREEEQANLIGEQKTWCSLPCFPRAPPSACASATTGSRASGKSSEGGVRASQAAGPCRVSDPRGLFTSSSRLSFSHTNLGRCVDTTLLPGLVSTWY